MKKEQGFTLIELIAVIVILGILAAVALPKFISLTGEARIAKMQGAIGAINSAGVLVHSKFLAAGSPTSGTLAYEGGTLTITTDLVNGYPTAGKISTVAGLSSTDFTFGSVAGGAITISDPNKSACSITFTEAAAGAAPTITSTALTNANCQ